MSEARGASFPCLAVFGVVALIFPWSGASAQGAGGTVLEEEHVGAGETGTGWIEEAFGGLLAVESTRIRPPDTAFEGEARRLVVELLEEEGGWRTIMDLPVDPTAARDSSIWSRVSLAPEIRPEMEAAYALIRDAMERSGRSEPESHGFHLEASWMSPVPFLAKAIRFEMIGPNAPGKAWTFLLRTDPFSARHGGVSHEWTYTHVG